MQRAKGLILGAVVLIGGLSMAHAEHKPGHKTTPVRKTTRTKVVRTKATKKKPAARKTSSVIKTASGLIIQDLKKGTGAVAKTGNTVTVHYRGTLTNGQKFDASYDRGQPFPFQLGAGQVIKGWDQGVAGMRVGGKRKLTIPPHLGYGASGAGNVIPPNATLIFVVELLKVN